MNKPLAEELKPVIGITLGDYNGIGPEVIIKALADNRILEICVPVIYGASRILSKYRKTLNIEDWPVHAIKNIAQLHHKKINLIQCFEDKNIEVEPGKITPEAGKYAFESLKMATEDLKHKHLHAIVTAPINKHTIQSDAFQFVGHTEYFTQYFEAAESLMLLVADDLKIGTLTGHMPLKDVASHITQDLLLKKINILVKTLKKDFGITKPKIAVLGLNPHAGEAGLLGDEEKNTLIPTIEALKQKGNLIFGPFPADGFFGNKQYKKYDAVLAMYHDQGLIPFKTLAFEKGVNYTAGLPIIRTSPDHGTAYNMAGKDLADETSMREAIYLAVDIFKQRSTSDIA